ncbi:MAG TPA: O-antigen ligase family protein, partial [Acidiferrobacteraceae bacterium]|nr:O-antigen ligase family protein [Acidiferrobacteraceae bacterium]
MASLRVREYGRPPLTALLLAAALGAALFFQGGALAPLSLALTLLMGAGVAALWDPASVALPVSGITLTLGLFWLWLALSVAGSLVPTSSIAAFWWLSLLPLSFLITLARGDSGRVAQAVLALAAAVCCVLAASALYQALYEHTIPDSLFLNTNSQDALFNLVILPGLALWLALRGRAPRWAGWAAATAVAFLIMTLGVTEERGPLIALALGLVALFGSARRALPRGSLWRALVLVGGALVLADLMRRGHPGGRLATVAHPVSALATRLVIWKAALRLAAHVPWHGIGLGLFSLAFPPYRAWADTSAGFFAHDDYLQIYIEAGWPALLLLLLLLGSVALLFRKTLHQWAPEDGRRIPAAALF